MFGSGEKGAEKGKRGRRGAQKRRAGAGGSEGRGTRRGMEERLRAGVSEGMGNGDGGINEGVRWRSGEWRVGGRLCGCVGKRRSCVSALATSRMAAQ